MSLRAKCDEIEAGFDGQPSPSFVGISFEADFQDKIRQNGL